MIVVRGSLYRERLRDLGECLEEGCEEFLSQNEAIFSGDIKNHLRIFIGMLSA